MSDRRIQKHPIITPDSEATIKFTFNGKEYMARPGEMISSAMMAHGREFSAPMGNVPSAWFWWMDSPKRPALQQLPRAWKSEN